ATWDLLAGGLVRECRTTRVGTRHLARSHGNLSIVRTDHVAGLLDRELSSLVERLRDFTAARYRAGAPPFETRADAAYHLVRVLASLADPAHADVPRLPDLALADQLAVVAQELTGAERSDDVAARALAEIAL